MCFILNSGYVLITDSSNMSCSLEKHSDELLIIYLGRLLHAIMSPMSIFHCVARTYTNVSPHYQCVVRSLTNVSPNRPLCRPTYTNISPTLITKINCFEYIFLFYRRLWYPWSIIYLFYFLRTFLSDAHATLINPDFKLIKMCMHCSINGTWHHGTLFDNINEISFNHIDIWHASVFDLVIEQDRHNFNRYHYLMSKERTAKINNV